MKSRTARNETPPNPPLFLIDSVISKWHALTVNAIAQATLKSARPHPINYASKKQKPLAGLLDGNSEGEGLGGEDPPNPLTRTAVLSSSPGVHMGRPSKLTPHHCAP
jgi:hypothetical protein